MSCTIEHTVYTFSELSEEAKEKALNYFRNSGVDYYGWGRESLESIKAFCGKFGVILESWEIGPWSSIDYSHDADNSNFRGIKLRSIDREEMLTGYCLDCDLMYTFYDTFKRTGDALAAFDDALAAGFKTWRDDWENFYSDDSLSEFIEANEYEFLQDGSLFD